MANPKLRAIRNFVATDCDIQFSNAVNYVHYGEHTVRLKLCGDIEGTLICGDTKQYTTQNLKVRKGNPYDSDGSISVQEIIGKVKAQFPDIRNVKVTFGALISGHLIPHANVSFIL